ncbi:MAG: nucleotidyltransferase family protein [Candidatus Omnitrophota bacterium]
MRKSLIASYFCLNNIDIDRANSKIDWNCFVKTARSDNITSLLYQEITRSSCDKIKIPPHIQKILKEDYVNTTTRNLIILQELNRVLGNFTDKRISVIVLKGAALLENVYQDIGLRNLADIDLLIRKEQLPGIIQTLEQLGYTTPFNWVDYKAVTNSRYLNSIYYVRPKGKISVILHLHWHIINTTVPAYTYGDIDVERFWQGAEPATIANCRTKVLSPHHLIIHLSEHLLKHSYHPFILFCDLAQAISSYLNNRLDWETLICQSREMGLQRPVYYALYFTRRFLKIDIPEKATQRLKPEHPCFGEKKIMTLVEENKKFPELKYFFHFVMSETVKDKLKFVQDCIFPSREILALQYCIPPQEIKISHYLLKLKSACVKGLGGLTNLFSNYRKHSVHF